ncbi:hypothetical protein C1645_823290 [Glomus cerebriforme]|uniref:Uncharacterized protein n=1 Tax=Glomus cerebriforme TaxID=658196 RepID=A0A397T0U4_9GLOM|nr:hypothetical protein C1645_823290 [Glomus cerebriforme]
MASMLLAKDILMSHALTNAARVSRFSSLTSALISDLLDKAFSFRDTLKMADLIATSHGEIVYWIITRSINGSHEFSFWTFWNGAD